MAYSLEEEKEQLNNKARSARSASVDELLEDSAPSTDKLEQETAYINQKEYNGQLEETNSVNGQASRAIVNAGPNVDEFEEDLPPNLKKPRSKGGWLTPLVIGTGIGLALAFLGMRLLPASQNKGTSPVAQTKESVAPSLSVSVAPVETTTVSRTLNATGSIAAYDLLPVLPQATGLQIKQVLADEGDIVKVGQILAVLDNSVLQTQLQQAKAQLESSQAAVGQKQAALAQAKATLAQSLRELTRYQYLANQGAINRQDLETRSTTVTTNQQAVQVAIANIGSAQADVRSNKAKIQQLQTQIEQTLVRAPANGIVAEKNARVGDVSTGFQTQPLFRIIRDGYLELQLKVPETQLSEVRIGAPVKVTSKMDDRIRLEGKVRDISPLVDQQTRQATVKVDLPSFSYKEFRLRPGMFLQADIVFNTAQALSVPATAVLPQSDGKAIVYLLNGDNTVKAQTVEVGVTINGAPAKVASASNDLSNAKVEIKSGLKLGDRVVVDGAGYLKDGDTVRVVQQPSQ